MKTANITKTFSILKSYYPDGGALEIGNPFVMVVAVMLSARTQDTQVLKVMPGLMAKFGTPQKMANANVDDIAKLISSIGMFRQKAKNLQKLAALLVSDFGGVVPDTIDELVRLPGVGRKTASVVLVAAFHKPAIAVDVHVARIVRRLGWAKSTTPEKIEQELLDIVPAEMQQVVNHTMVPFGRAICVSGTPRCWACPVRDLCAFPKKNLEIPKNADQILSTIKEREAALATLKKAAKKDIQDT